MVLSLVFRGRLREKLRGEQGSLLHVAFDLHLALDESILGVQGAHADFFKVVISHGESGVGGLFLSDIDLALAVLQVNHVGFEDGAFLGLFDVEVEDSFYLLGQVFAFTAGQELGHHGENFIGFEVGGLLSGLGFLNFSFGGLGGLFGLDTF